MKPDVTPPTRRRPKLKSKPKRPVKPPKPEGPETLPAAIPEEPAFKTPDEIALEEAGNDLRDISQAPPPKARRKRRPYLSRRWLALYCLIAIVAVGGGLTAWSLTHRKNAPIHQQTAIHLKPTAPKAIIYSNLSGLPITDPGLNKKPVTAVMVENSLDARPQSGLSQAGVVFEAQAEGGVTRFMALYQDTSPDNVGPIRSARPYYVQWALGFDAAYAHVGGSPDALSDITGWHVQDMNQFYNGSYYHRVSSRAAPHNVYTGIDTLNKLESKDGYSSDFTGFPRAGKPAPTAQPTATSIDLAISGPLYNPHYDYDSATNTYARSIDGTTQTDANTGKQLSPAVVIAIVVPLSRGALDASGAYYSDYNAIGSGAAYIFQNGTEVTGQWHKASNTGQLTFTDDNGGTIPLARGQTWISAVAAAGQVAYHGPAATATK